MQELMKSSSLWMMAEGIFLILLGIFALAIPQVFSLSLEFLIGILFVLSGVVYGSQAIRNYPGSSYWTLLLNALLALGVGLLLLFFPLSGIFTLTLLLMVFFLMDGIFKVTQSFQIREMKGWYWLLISGVLSLLIAGLIFSGWPGTSPYILGTFVGISLTIIGAVVFAIGYQFKQISSGEE